MDELKYKCNFCEKIYKLKSSMLNHKNIKHNQERIKERIKEKLQAQELKKNKSFFS